MTHPAYFLYTPSVFALGKSTSRFQGRLRCGTFGAIVTRRGDHRSSVRLCDASLKRHLERM